MDETEKVKDLEPEKAKDQEPEKQESQESEKQNELPARPAKKDIRYRGPLSYRELRIIGWVCFAVSQIAAILMMAVGLKITDSSSITIPKEIFSFLASMMMPLFLLANFGLILKERSSFKKLLLFHGGVTLGIALAYYIVLYRYMLAIVNLLTEDAATSDAIFQLVLNAFLTNGLNVFLDLFLCTLFVFFLNYNPKRVFTGKKIIFFRLFALLVVGYEVFCLILKLKVAFGEWVLPTFFFPWIASKPFAVFIAFALVACSIKIRASRHLHKGKSQQEWDAYEKSNRNSLHVSIVMAVVFGIVAILDGLAALIATVALVGDPSNEELLYAVLNALLNVGIGKGTILLLVVPICLLYSYTRERKKPELDKFIPLVGIGLTAIVYIEGIYYLITHLPKQ